MPTAKKSRVGQPESSTSVPNRRGERDVDYGTREGKKVIDDFHRELDKSNA